jgi:Pyridoxamine 5'-phosphate oxidase
MPHIFVSQYHRVNRAYRLWQRTRTKMMEVAVQPAQAPPEVTEIDLNKWSDAINNALAEGTPCLLATADASGYPDIAFKGSMMVFDKDHVAWWERSLAEQIEQVEKNPHVVVLYRNATEARRIPHMRIYGDATIHRSGDLREQVMAKTVQRELDQDPERKGFAVVVTVNRVRLGRNTVQERKGA